MRRRFNQCLASFPTGLRISICKRDRWNEF